MNPTSENPFAEVRPGRIAHVRFDAVLLSCLLALGGLGHAMAQTPDEPRAAVPAVVEAVATASAAAAGGEAASGPDEAQAPDEDSGSGDVPANAQADAAAVLAGGTNSPAGSTNSPSGPPSSRREGRSWDRGERGSRDWRSSFGSASRSKSGGTNAAPEIPKTDYAYFKVVNDRNIFNPARQPNRPDRPASREVKRTPKVDAFSLVGTLRYEKGDMAFFDGSSPDYRKAHKAGDTIAGYKVLSITDAAVRIEAQGKVTELKIGSQMRREDEGEWVFAEGPYAGGSGGSSGSGGSTSSGSGESSTASASTGSSAGGGSSSGGGADEILKRLLQKREQEMKNEK
jgi:hypothetical protein